MILTIIAYFLITMVSAGLGYWWGYHDKDEEYIRGLETGATIGRATRVMLNGKIKDLEEENDLLRIRLGEDSSTGMEDQYLTMEDTTE